MKVLALDTTTRAGSTALVEDDRVVDERAGDGALTHALRMPAEILALAESNGWPIGAIDLFAVASGPAPTLERWRGIDASPKLVIGDGAEMYATEVASGAPDARVVALPMLAGVIGRLAHARASEALDPESVRPLYVRRPAVELARDE